MFSQFAHWKHKNTTVARCFFPPRASPFSFAHAAAHAIATPYQSLYQPYLRRVNAASTPYIRRIYAASPPTSEPAPLSRLRVPCAWEPEVSRMAWLNKIVDYTWPQIDTAVCATVRGAMEPILRTSVPPIVSWIGFEKISLVGWWPLCTPGFGTQLCSYQTCITPVWSPNQTNCTQSFRSLTKTAVRHYGHPTKQIVLKKIGPLTKQALLVRQYGPPTKHVSRKISVTHQTSLGLVPCTPIVSPWNEHCICGWHSSGRARRRPRSEESRCTGPTARRSCWRSS